MITHGDVAETAGEPAPPTRAIGMPGSCDMGELPQEFHERLTRLLAAFPHSTLASVHPAKQSGSWAVELLFGDRRETFVVNYVPDQRAV